MKMAVGRRDIYFNMGYEPWWKHGILHFPEVLSFAEEKTSARAKNMHTSDQVSNPQPSE
jgi:hypothetical protein